MDIAARILSSLQKSVHPTTSPHQPQPFTINLEPPSTDVDEPLVLAKRRHNLAALSIRTRLTFRQDDQVPAADIPISLPAPFANPNSRSASVRLQTSFNLLRTRKDRTASIDALPRFALTATYVARDWI